MVCVVEVDVSSEIESTAVPSTLKCKPRLRLDVPSGFVSETVAPKSEYVLPTEMLAGLLPRMVMTGAVASVDVATFPSDGGVDVALPELLAESPELSPLLSPLGGVLVAFSAAWAMAKSERTSF